MRLMKPGCACHTARDMHITDCDLNMKHVGLHIRLIFIIFQKLLNAPVQVKCF